MTKATNKKVPTLSEWTKHPNPLNKNTDFCVGGHNEEPPNITTGGKPIGAAGRGSGQEGG